MKFAYINRVKEGKILVGWSAAKVRALEPLPMRCFRCMGTGHTRALCPSPVDRGELCYRCSKPGHKAAECEAEAFCSVCHQAKRPTGHVMGGRSCAPPPKKGLNGPGIRAPERPQSAQAAEREQTMDF